MAFARPVFGVSCRVALGCVLAWLSAARAPAEGGGMPPDVQIFVNAREEITRACVYRPSAREVLVGALRALAKRVGPKFADALLTKVPEDPGEALMTYAAELQAVVDEPGAREAGWTMRKLVETSIDAYCQTLDAYSNYTDLKTSGRLEAARRPDYVGIGVTLRRNERGFFCSPFRGGAADRAGVQNGDELLELNGANARGMTLLELSEALTGAPGSAVKLRVKHTDGVSEVLQAKREQIASTPLAVDDSGTASRITFVRINDRAYEDLRTTLAALGPGHEITLDFRGCGGGDLNDAIRMAELFLPEKTAIARFESSREKEFAVSHNPAPYRPKRLLLLQDEGTASGAELIIAALLGYPPLKAESRGEKTYGKGVTARQIRVARGGLLVITDSRIFGPHDEFWDGEGLPPSSDKKIDAP